MNQQHRGEFDFGPLESDVDVMKKRMEWLDRQLKGAIDDEQVGSAIAEGDYKELQRMVNEYKRIRDSVKVVLSEAAVTLVEYQKKRTPEQSG